MKQPPCEQIKQFLSSGEQVVWQGRPGKGRLFERIDYFLVPFAILWAAVPTTMFVTMLIKGITDIFALPVSFMFLLIGFYLVFGRFLIKKRILNNTCYAITNRRIILVENKKITFLDRGNLPQYSLDILKDGYGNINFKDNSLFSSFFDYDILMINASYPRLKNIENVQDVLKILTKTPQQ